LLVEFHATGGKPALVLVHPLAGHVFCYQELAARLSEYYDIYGLRAIGLEIGELPLDQLEEIGRRYCIELDKFLSSNLVLAGWSTGGVIAYEMYRQLYESGKKPLGLVLLDAQLDFANGRNDDRSRNKELPAPTFPKVAAGEDCRDDSTRRILQKHGVDSSTMEPDQLSRTIGVMRGLEKALNDYQPGRSGGKLVVANASGSTPSPWHGLCDEVVSCLLEGSHFEVLSERNLAHLVKTFSDLRPSRVVHNRESAHSRL
jgi:thioesterase domain-containing protein